VHWFIGHYLLLRTGQDQHREVCSTRLSELRLGAFKNPSRIAYQPSVGLTIGYHSNSWASFLGGKGQKTTCTSFLRYYMS